MRSILLALGVLVMVGCKNTDGEDRVLNDSLVFNKKEKASSNVEEAYFKNRVLLDSLVFDDKEQTYYFNNEPFNGIMFDVAYYNNYEKGTFIHYEIEIKNGKKDGLGKWWYPNNETYCEKNYKNGKQDGISKNWHVHEGEHWNWHIFTDLYAIRENIDHFYRSWYNNGQLLSEENYKDGKLDGFSKWWYLNGQFKREAYYKDGKVISQKCSDEEGIVIDCPK